MIMMNFVLFKSFVYGCQYYVENYVRKTIRNLSSGDYIDIHVHD